MELQCLKMGKSNFCWNTEIKFNFSLTIERCITFPERVQRCTIKHNSSPFRKNSIIDTWIPKSMESDEDSYGSDVDGGSNSTLSLYRTGSRLSSNRSSASRDEYARLVVLDDLATSWSKYVSAFNLISRIQIRTHSIVEVVPNKQKSLKPKKVIVYTFDFFLNLWTHGLLLTPHQMQGRLKKLRPHYELEYRFSQCHDLRLRLIKAVQHPLHRSQCHFCFRMHEFLTLIRFPIRWPIQLVEKIPGLHRCVIQHRKCGRIILRVLFLFSCYASLWSNARIGILVQSIADGIERPSQRWWIRTLWWLRERDVPFERCTVCIITPVLFHSLVSHSLYDAC